MLCFVPLLLSGRTDLVIVGAGAQAWLGTAINMPHFMASYRLVYRDRASILKHRWASMYIPALLLTCVSAGTVGSANLALPGDRAGHDLEFVPGVALHGAGVGNDGVTCVAFRHDLGAARAAARAPEPQDTARVAGHVVLYRASQLRNPAAIEPLYKVAIAASAVAFVLGLTAFAMVKRRTGQLPPLKSLVAWLAHVRVVCHDVARSQGHLLDPDCARPPVSRVPHPGGDQPDDRP